MKSNDLEMRFVFTSMPGAGSDCVFVEVEDSTGASINAGEWRTREDGLVELVVLPKLITISGLRDDLECSSATGYTAVDMATAAAQGFRDGQASVVVELPGSFLQDYINKNEVMDAERVIEAIIAAGGKVKE